ncbi:DeoR/GlpR family DNA-binding transcription regulator [Amycolatopsis sp.]|uniref:DeoR/GlpR family DNA-binding transcription regulator n=1 Tax=Amycolatopsis sp. TaxID=37632 RepID=UPI002B9FCA93|nr:DeoR/GlpR family DNA-binding transcription regulator [Amycolatopsis sp.]HVV08289.1 DeoR/GlpR family DNA-binding transcription regulator [Amycolatopsis sp.]
MTAETTSDLRYDGAQQRRARILERVSTTGFLPIAVLADDLGVSEQTVRRDLRRLEEAGQLKVVYGGASAIPNRTPPTPTAHFAIRAGRNADAKKRIAARAAELIEPTDAIAIDSGTTPFALAEALPAEFAGTVITVSIPVIQLLLHREDVQVIGLGGNAMANREAFAGPMTLEAAARVRARTMFLGAEAADARGLYIVADGNPDVQLRLMENADRSVLLIDHTKFERPGPVLLAGLDQLDAVVTDRRPPSDVERAIRAAGAELFVADAQVAK